MVIEDEIQTFPITKLTVNYILLYIKKLDEHPVYIFFPFYL